MASGMPNKRKLEFFSRGQFQRRQSPGIRFLALLARVRALPLKSAVRISALQGLETALTGLLILVILGSAALIADARLLEVSKKGREYEVRIQIDKSPPIIGTNNIAVEIRDSGGRTVTNAAVLINYYMPPMPRMVPMFYRTNAPVREGKYCAAMNFVMSGPWIIAVKVTRGGKTTTAKFNVDAQ
jgi:hypothetical protein